MQVSETASDGSKAWVPAGAGGETAGEFATFEFSLVEVFRETDGLVAKNDGAAGNSVETFALAEGKAGSFANGTNFAAVRVFAPSAVSEIFEEQQVVVFFNFFKLANVDREAKGILEDETF